MPLRTAYQHCPHAIFVEGHPDRYRDYSGRVREILDRFSPLVEMASIDEAYLDMTGSERLLGPPLAAAHSLHGAIKSDTDLNCSIGIASSRLVAKITSDQAKPNGVLWVLPGEEASFLAPLDVRKIPGVGEVTEKNLHQLGIRKIGDLATLDQEFLGASSASGDWRWPAKRSGSMLVDGSIPLSAQGKIRSRSATSIPTRRTWRIQARSKPPWPGSPRWLAAVCANTACTPERYRSSFATRIHDDHARALARPFDAAR